MQWGVEGTKSAPPRRLLHAPNRVDSFLVDRKPSRGQNMSPSSLVSSSSFRDGPMPGGDLRAVRYARDCRAAGDEHSVHATSGPELSCADQELPSPDRGCHLAFSVQAHYLQELK